jgi:hypothetical protein
MKARWILNLVLAGVIATLAAFLYFKPAGDPSVGPPLTALAADAVTQIRIERGTQTIELEKTDIGWRLRAPLAARANRFNVDSLLRITSAPSSFQATPSELGTYGLDQPTLRLRLNDEEIAIGAIHPMRQQHYVRYRDTVHLIPSAVLTAAFQPYTGFIDTQLLEHGRKLAALRLPGLRLELQDGTWRREPHDPQLSVDRLNGFVAEWEHARALSVAKLAARPAQGAVQLTFEQDGKRQTLTLDILAARPELVLARRDEGLEYHFPEDVGKRLLTLAAE